MPAIAAVLVVLFVVSRADTKSLVPPISLLGFMSCTIAVGVGALVACLSGHWVLGVIVGIVGLLISILADDCL
jgi:hypothetical protein